MTSQQLKKAKVGSRVLFGSRDEGNYAEGKITLIVGRRFEVTWDDGEVYSYETDIGQSSLRLV